MGNDCDHTIRVVKLLVSAANAKDAFEAALGGAEIVDAKDPAAGALGAVSLERFVRMREVVPPAVPVSAALGDALAPHVAELMAAAFAQAGAAFVKLPVPSVARDVAAILVPAVRGATGASGNACGVVAALFGDQLPVGRSLDDVATAVRDAGADGLLIDTADKRGQRLTELIPIDTLAAWVRSAQRAGLFAAVAGRLTLDDVEPLRAVHADVVGVRGAVCVGGREGRVARERVTAWRAACDRQAAILARSSATER